MILLPDPGLAERRDQGTLEIADWTSAVEIKGERRSERKKSPDGYARIERHHGRYRRFICRLDAGGLNGDIKTSSP